MNSLMSVALLLGTRQQMIINKLTECCAFSEESAVPLETAGVLNPGVLPKFTKRLVKRNILKQTADGRYYLNRKN